MLELTINVTKAALLGLWLACILSLVSLIPAPYGQTILWLGGVVLLVHFVEYLLVRSKVAERQEGKTGFAGTMVYGFGYWLPVLRRSQ
jgi:uncharacterized protein YhhL (DUF1145 family)